MMTLPSSIAAPAIPIFAVFTESGDQDPRSKADLDLMACPFVVRETDSKCGQVLQPFVLTEIGFEKPEVFSNFLGYADSLEQAIRRFLP